MSADDQWPGPRFYRRVSTACHLTAEPASHSSKRSPPPRTQCTATLPAVNPIGMKRARCLLLLFPLPGMTGHCTTKFIWTTCPKRQAPASLVVHAARLLHHVSTSPCFSKFTLFAARPLGDHRTFSRTLRLHFKMTQARELHAARARARFMNRCP